MAANRGWKSVNQSWQWLMGHLRPVSSSTRVTIVILAGLIGVLAGFGAIIFSQLIHVVNQCSVEPVMGLISESHLWRLLLCVIPAIGLLLVAWFTRRFAPEAQGHGVPEVITAIARHDGIIRPRVALVKIMASGFCIGTGGSIGREGPIVQIGSALGSTFGQSMGLSARHIKVLVAAGAAAGISATFNAPLAGVIFASEIILGSFAVESLTPIVIASVLADVVQQHFGEHGMHSAFIQLHFEFGGAWEQLPSYLILGLVCGLAAVGFTKLLYATEDVAERILPKWWVRALVLGCLVGIGGAIYPIAAPVLSSASRHGSDVSRDHTPPLFGVGYDVVDHALHLENEAKPKPSIEGRGARVQNAADEKSVSLDRSEMLRELWWLLPLAILKPLMTSLTLAGGGSGGIFAPSLFLGATLGASFGLICNLLVPGLSANPGVYAIVGMGAVVSGTTHGMLSAILIVYEMTDDYRIILPIMVAAGIASLIARYVDPESIYQKKLSRRGESIARGDEMHRVEHIMVRDVMIKDYPTVMYTDNLIQIIKVAKQYSHIESIPVMNAKGNLVGIIRPEALHRVIDTSIPNQLINAEDIAQPAPLAVSPDENLLEALRDFGTRDIESLPVETGKGDSRELVGLLLRADVMKRYREEMLQHY